LDQAVQHGLKDNLHQYLIEEKTLRLELFHLQVEALEEIEMFQIIQI
jgi:hypothetical protein